MRAPVSWLLEHVDLPSAAPFDLAARLTAAGLKVETVEEVGDGIKNVVVARVEAVEELTGFKKPIRWVTVTDGTDTRQVICGATNFAVGDVVAYARPPAELPGGFSVDRRTAYGRESDGMICSVRELGIGDDHSGILVLGHEGDVPLGADVVDAYGLRDAVLDVAVNPDRGYALSIRGLARELAIAYGVAFRDPAADGATPAAGAGGYAVSVEDADGCDRYVALGVAELDPAATSPLWLQRRLSLAGMRPISLAVDVTNHVMLELGQPLHAFDRDRMSGAIVVRRARSGERLRTLDDVERTLDPADLLITDDSGPIAIAGVMGGLSTEIGTTTRTIVLESAHFDPVSIAYTARRHRLSSEASRRFERGVDPALALVAAGHAGRLLAELGGAAVDTLATDVDTHQVRPVIVLDPALPSRVTGVDYERSAVRLRLEDVGCTVEDQAGAFHVTAPSWRPDLRLPIDLVEEVTRLEGYDRLPSTVPDAPVGRGLTRSQRQRRTLSRALAAGGFAEVLSFPFVAAASADALMLASDDPRRPTVRLANPVSNEEPFLRATLLTGLLTALARNAGRGFSDVALFESGPVFRSTGDAAMPSLPAGRRPSADELAEIESTLPDQPLHVAVAIAGRWERAGWWGPGREVMWADAVEAVRRIAASLGVDVQVAAARETPWHPGRCAAVVVEGVTIGHAGELHPRVIDALALPPRTCAAEIAVAPLLAAAPEVVSGAAVSPFPPALLDVALVVPLEVSTAELAAALREGAGPLAESVRLFDAYVGEQVPVGHRSLAFTLRLRATDHTLTSEEATAVRDAAVSVAAERFGAVLRT